jgi:hypothetical protein
VSFTPAAGESAISEAISASGALNLPRRNAGGTTASTASSFSQWLPQAKQDTDLIFSGSEVMMSDFIAAMPDQIDAATVTPLYLRPSAILVRPGNPQRVAGIGDLLKPGRRILVVNGAVAAARTALLQRPRREGMTQVMDARPTRSSGRDLRLRQQDPEDPVDGRGAERPGAHRWEQVIETAGEVLAPREVSVERLDYGRMQRDETALVELDLADTQHAVGKNFVTRSAMASEMRRPVAAIRPNIVT